MKQGRQTKHKLAESLSALFIATAFVAPAPALMAADLPAKTDSKAEPKNDAKNPKIEKAENPCGPSNPCAPGKKKKKRSSDNPCSPANPCAPKK
ncbi:hypothetical protein [Undibacterium sp.]|uniref:hypothetical protein n=1 Tax=Undibacterium sp. TaxID=1914977 RepID=UPI00272A9A8B|nr:hypothetical protein [Undibacterium sp.]